jgi:hypothetical protein
VWVWGLGCGVRGGVRTAPVVLLVLIAVRWYIRGAVRENDSFRVSRESHTSSEGEKRTVAQEATCACRWLVWILSFSIAFGGCFLEASYSPALFGELRPEGVRSELSLQKRPRHRWVAAADPGGRRSLPALRSSWGSKEPQLLGAKRGGEVQFWPCLFHSY